MRDLLAEDIENVISDPAVPWAELRGSSVLVTGATGTIGGAIIRVLGELNRRGYGIVIFAIGRNREKGMVLEKIKGVRFIAADIREKLDVTADYIFHCAAVAESVKMVSDPVGVIDTELAGGKNLLELARKNHIKGMVYTSSMEAYGILSLESVTERDMGYLDLTKSRSSYPQAKRMMETLCNCYFAQYGLPVNIVRLGMTFGAGMDFTYDNRVWAQFARSVTNCSPIVLHTAGESLSAFAYITDALRGMFLVLLSPRHGETYNVASVCIKIKDLAQRVAQRFGLNVVIDLPENINAMGYASEFMFPLNTRKLQKLGWQPLVTEVEEMFLKTIEGVTR